MHVPDERKKEKKKGERNEKEKKKRNARAGNTLPRLYAVQTR